MGTDARRDAPRRWRSAPAGAPSSGRPRGCRGRSRGSSRWGCLLRVARYLLNFPLWCDETMIAANFLDRGYADLFRPLDYRQVSPVLFLVIELTAVKLLGFSELSLRLFPMVCGVASVPLFRHAAGRVLAGVPLLLAVAVFAVAGWPLRYVGGGQAVRLRPVRRARAAGAGAGVVAGAGAGRLALGAGGRGAGGGGAVAAGGLRRRGGRPGAGGPGLEVGPSRRPARARGRATSRRRRRSWRWPGSTRPRRRTTTTSTTPGPTPSPRSTAPGGSSPGCSTSTPGSCSRTPKGARGGAAR